MRIKRLLPILLALVLVFSLAMPAFAANVDKSIKYPDGLVVDGSESWNTAGGDQYLLEGDFNVLITFINEPFLRNEDNWSNFVFEIFGGEDTKGITLRADAFGWLFGEETQEPAYAVETTWGDDWDSFKTICKENTNVTLNLKKTSDTEVTATINFGTAAKEVYTITYPNGVPASMQAQVGSDGGKVTILSAVIPNLPKAGEGDIVILHSNDVHGAVNGYATMAALKAHYAELGAKVLLVDAGDYIQGTTYVSVSQGATAIELMNLAGYDYAALGNHEFDYGYANMVELAKKAEFEILSANTLYNGEPAFGTHVVVELGDKTVGIFGLETPETATKAHPAKIQGVTFLAGEELYACAQAEVNALQEAGCDYIICLGHLGVDDETAATANRSIDLLKKVEGIDVFVDGHSHSTIGDIEGKNDGSNKVGDTLVTSTGTKFNNYGAVIIKADGTITADLIPAADAAVAVGANEEVAARAAEIVAEIEAIYGAKFAETEVLLNGDRDPGNRTEETNLGDLITDSMLWFATKDGGLDVDADHVVAITNGGGIRATIAAGDITMNNINTVLPFGNTVAVVYVTGEALLEALEASTYSTPTAVGGFPQVAGIEFTIDTTAEFDAGDLYPGTTYAKPASINRVTITSINGLDFDPEATYAVVTNDFCAAGGDTYYAFSVAPSVMDTGTPLDEALVQYITEVLEGVITAEKYGEVRGSITIVSEPKEPEVTEPEVTEPEVTEPEVTEPEVTEPEVTEPKREGATSISGNLTVDGFFTNRTNSVGLKSGESYTFKFNNKSNGAANWSNFIMGITGVEASAGAADEILIIRADAWGWGGGMSDFVDPNGTGNALVFDTNAVWEDWLPLMQAGCDVTVTISRSGNTLSYTATMGDYYVKLKATSGVALPEYVFVFFTGEDCVLSNIRTVSSPTNGSSQTGDFGLYTFVALAIFAAAGIVVLQKKRIAA